MALIVASGKDPALLARWSDALQSADHDCLILPPSTIAQGLPADCRICLFDLGRRGRASLAGLTGLLRVSEDKAVVAMSADPQAEEGLQVLRAGARGYVNRQAAAAVLQAVVSTVLAGEVWAGRQVTDHLLDIATSGSAAPEAASTADILARLTPREAEIARQVAAGLSNKVIAIDAGISERTVKAHLNAIFRKTGIRNRVQLALTVSQLDTANQRLSNG